MSELILELVYKCGKQNQGLNNNQNSAPAMQQDSHQLQNSASYQNQNSNNMQEYPINHFRLELNSAQLAYLSKLLPKSYSLQIQSKTVRRALSSQKSARQDSKVPTETKRKATKDEPKSIPQPKANQRPRNLKINEEIENAVYQKYNVQKQISRRNGFEGIQQSLRPCVRLLNLLKNSRTSWPFREPVDPVALGIPHYRQIVKEPMDLSTIENNLKTNQYITPTQFHADVSKIITNSYTFNSANMEFTRVTAQFEAYYRKITSDPSQPMQRGYSHTEIPAQLYTVKSGADKKTKKDKQSDFGSSVNTVISMNEKKQLGLNIKKLAKEHMKGVLDIVNEGKVKTVGQFDLKQLDAHVIRRLQQYVKQKLAGENKHRATYAQEKHKDGNSKQESSFELDQEDES